MDDNAKSDAPSDPGNFTVSSNIEQLCAIDKTIAELMAHAASALAVLGDPSSATSSSSSPAPSNPTSGEDTLSGAPTPTERLQAFREASDAFLSALHSVDVRMKRQLWALEEADILRLGNVVGKGERVDAAGTTPSTAEVAGPAAAAAAAGGAGVGVGAPGDKKTKASLAPNAMGAFGGLDVGWLNSRIAGGGVERDMEGELWARARAVLENVGRGEVKMEDRGGGGGSG